MVRPLSRILRLVTILLLVETEGRQRGSDRFAFSAMASGVNSFAIAAGQAAGDASTAMVEVLHWGIGRPQQAMVMHIVLIRLQLLGLPMVNIRRPWVWRRQMGITQGL